MSSSRWLLTLMSVCISVNVMQYGHINAPVLVTWIEWS